MEAMLPGDMAITTGRRDHGVWDWNNLNLVSFILQGSGITKRIKLYTEQLSLERSI